MAKVIIAHRNGLEYPMVRCPLTNMGIYFEKTEWNGDIKNPTFSKEVILNHGAGSFSITDGVCIYSPSLNHPVITLKDWDDTISSAEAIFYKENRKKYQIVK